MNADEKLKLIVERFAGMRQALESADKATQRMPLWFSISQECAQAVHQVQADLEYMQEVSDEPGD